jgi:hypothetical protein
LIKYFILKGSLSEKTRKFACFQETFMEYNETLNAASAQVDGTALLEVGTWLGRHQAFGLIANKCSAADAACLRQIRDSRRAGVDYRTGETW